MTKARCVKCGGILQLIGIVAVYAPKKGFYVQYKCRKCNSFFNDFVTQKVNDAKEQKTS